MKKSQIWILEDDEACQFVYAETLDIRYETELFGTLKEFRDALEAAEELPELIIADMRLPDGTFLKFLANDTLATKITCPFIIVSSLDDHDLLRTCFEEGALDYMTKPFNKGELLVKVQFILEKKHPAQKTKEVHRDIAIDGTAMKVSNQEGAVRLTPKEMQILNILKEANTAVSRQDMIEKVWEDTVVGSRTLDVHLFNLRKKTKKLGIQINFIPPSSFILEKDKD